MSERGAVSVVDLWRLAAAARNVDAFVEEASTIVRQVQPGLRFLGFARAGLRGERLELVGELPRTEASEARWADAFSRLDSQGWSAPGAGWSTLVPFAAGESVVPVTFDGSGFHAVGVLVRPEVLDDRGTLPAVVEALRVAGVRLFEEQDVARRRESLEAEREVLVSKLQKQQIVEEIVGEGRGLRDVMDRIGSVAPTDAPVLILGETGSGKEMVARAVHERSAYARGPIVRVNCGAIPTELVDSELFGHEKGSFTGAIGTRKGWFERADGGTLFLDEVGELPLAAQVRLLRVLQDGTLERVGGARPLHVRVRIVAATHRDLPRMVQEGSFRSDLWYRLCVFPVTLPPLRDRLEDLGDLARHFAARIGERLGSGPLPVTDADVQVLAAYPWPGNVRELASVIERAAILGRGARLDLATALGAVAVVPLARTNSVPSASLRPMTPAPPAPIQGNSLERLDEAMVTHIERALATTGGRIEGPHGAAALLHVNPHTLRARMRKLGIDWSRFRSA